MYDWLANAMQTPSVVVTANRRLARLLLEEFGRKQVADGKSAWESPRIQSWHDMLSASFASANDPGTLPTRINAEHSQVLWERCLGKELGNNATGTGSIARLCRDAWQRAADSGVGIREIAKSARSDDQKLFASVAGRYLSILEHEDWIDVSGIAAVVIDLIEADRVTRPDRLFLAGFDREPAALSEVCEAFASKGCKVERVPVPDSGANPIVMQYSDSESELRAAGCWARERLDENPGARIAIVKQGLEQTAERDVRLVREGAVPGWQYGGASLRDAVNVSYGRRLAEYPAIHIALLALGWLAGPLSSREVATLLLSPLFARGGMEGRSRLELQLRDLPERQWSPSMVTSALKRHEDDESGADWLTRVAWLSKKKRELPGRTSPAEWAILLHETVDALGWPGSGSLNSAEFQLVNRWRELLNELARLDLVMPSMSVSQAVGRLALLAQDTIFQAESGGATIQLLGPLEAAGGEYDALWVAGMTASDWPPAARPTPLLSRSLQIEHAMPDATPADTLSFARATLTRLVQSAGTVVCSYATHVDDTEQAASELLRTGGYGVEGSSQDPGWHAASLTGQVAVSSVNDSIPAVTTETLFGGAGTIERQMSEPFGAFVFGRLGASWLNRQAVGITPQLRGSVLHDALYRLYQHLPERAELLGWTDADLRDRVETAVSAAFVRHERNTDDVLAELFKLERRRIVELLVEFVRHDREREDFTVAAVEGKLEFRRRNIALSLRFDRIDRLAGDGISIIDYKTGMPRALLQKDGSVREPQLFVYAAAAEATVAALALVNIDSREISISGGGQGFTDEAVWPELLGQVIAEIDIACAELEEGDVRLDASQTPAVARRLNLLSRFTELSRDR